jgi:hypothetical protein
MSITDTDTEASSEDFDLNDIELDDDVEMDELEDDMDTSIEDEEEDL